ncbi:hypothetical protein SUDANB105_06573 [Streptomyces sp. enrichment culture]|uniref:hypothetical protein n=1 Tax=Streptomyces sp. enrichment culture TaxID=1795815 RepID=UPI003F57E51E
MPRSLTEANVLDVWESGLGRTPAVRALLLASLAAPAGHDVADLPLSALNALLLELRSGAFGDRLPCVTDCPQCGESLDVTVSTGELWAQWASRAAPATRERAEPATATLTAHGMEITFRALTARDVGSVDPAAPRARQHLLRRCVVDVSPSEGEIPDQALEEIARRLPGLDPGADPSFTLDCPQCEHRWEAPLDIADHLWTDVSGYAHRLLHEVHALARAYGWSEADALAVSPVRRQFYLEATAE